MNKYEITFIVKPDIEEAQIKKIADDMKKVLTDKKATIIEEKALGQRELSYEINKFQTGYYYLYVVRHLVVRVEEK